MSMKRKEYETVNQKPRRKTMSVEQFIWICNEYSIYPQLVMEDLRKFGKKITNEAELRAMLEECY